MKQELIDTFLVKIANKLTINEKIELQKQLQTCDDKAFALLMSNKAPAIISRKHLLCIISAITASASLMCFIECIFFSSQYDWDLYLIAALICLVVFMSLFFLIRIWYKRGELKYIPRRKRLYKDYLKIIQSYQEATQSIE